MEAPAQENRKSRDLFCLGGGSQKVSQRKKYLELDWLS